jgi:indole-3-acetate monooxygenase
MSSPGQGAGAKAIQANGGWRVAGTWSFTSDSRHVTWLGAMCPSFEADGTPIMRANGTPWERSAMFRREQARIAIHLSRHGAPGVA